MEGTQTLDTPVEVLDPDTIFLTRKQAVSMAQHNGVHPSIVALMGMDGTGIMTPSGWAFTFDEPLGFCLIKPKDGDVVSEGVWRRKAE